MLSYRMTSCPSLGLRIQGRRVSGLRRPASIRHGLPPDPLFPVQAPTRRNRKGRAAYRSTGVLPRVEAGGQMLPHAEPKPSGTRKIARTARNRGQPGPGANSRGPRAEQRRGQKPLPRTATPARTGHADLSTPADRRDRRGWASRAARAPRHPSRKTPGRGGPGVWSCAGPVQISKRSGRICSNRPVSASAFSTASGSGASR